MAIARIKKPKISLTVAILSAGESKKIKLPKCLIDIGRDKLVVRQVRIIERVCPEAEIIVVGGYCANEIYRILPKTVRFIENPDYDFHGQGRSLDMAVKNTTTENLMIVHGDLVFSERFVKIPTQTSLIINSKGKKDSVGCNISNNKVQHLTYTSKEKWGEIAYLEQKDLDILRKLYWNDSMYGLLTFEVLNAMINEGVQFIPEYTDLPLIEIDTAADIINFNLTENL